MKKSLLNVVALFVGITSVYANDAVFVFQGDTITPKTGYTIPCMGYQDTLVVKIDRNIFNPSQINHWSASGELKIKEDTTKGLDSVHIYSTGPARGGITISYDHGSCSGYSQGFFINKTFHPDSFNIKIEGPKCITDTQRVVYSVKPILTKNLGANIGIDSYIWNVLETPRPYFVDSILYVSGDTSSVTFRVSHVDPYNLPEIKVRIGACNEGRELILIPGNSTPKPEMIDTMYVPVGSEPFKVGVIKPDSSIIYTWSCSPASFTIEPFGIGDSATVKISNSALNADCNIYVSATYRDIQCNYSMDTMIVKRNWGSDVSFDSTKISGTCYTIAKGGKIDYYPFALKGAGLPTSSEFEWILPYGWKYKNDEVSYAQEIEVYPTNLALLVDTLRVHPRDSHDPAQPLSYTVYIKPDTIPYVRIKQDSCLAYNYEGGVYIDTTGLHMPEGVVFEWNVPDSIKGESGGTDTLRFRPNHETTSVQVRAKGKGGCDGEYTSYTITFKPQKPDAIVCPDCECISVNMPDTLRFYIANGLSTQTYSWNYTSNLTPHRINNDTIELITNGTPNAKDTVWVKAIQNNHDCPESDTIRQIISVTQPIVSIEYDGDDGSVRLLPRRPSGISNKHWYLLYNGMVVEDAFDNDDGTNNMLSEDFWDTIGDIDQFAGYTIVFEYTLNNCQRIRITYGTVIASNFMPTDTITISELPQSAQNHIRKREFTSDKRHNLMLYPNPATNLLNIHMNDETPFDVHIINTEGEKVYMSTNLSHYAIDVSFLPIGTYIVMATRNGKRLATKKLIRD